MNDDPNVNEAMHAFVTAGGNPSSIDAAPAVVAGLLKPARLTAGGTRYVCTHEGRRWLALTAEQNGATPTEALHSLDYIDGAFGE